MQDQQDPAPNARVIIIAAGGAALLAGLLLAMKRKQEAEEPRNRVEAAVADVKKSAKKAAKSAKKKQKDVAAAAEETREQVAERAREAGASVGFDAKAAERDLKAAAWDAQQEARAAEGRLRAAGHRVVDDATHLASRVGAEARNLAGEGRGRLAQMRQREEDDGGVERELARLRKEVEELRAQVRGGGRGGEKEFLGRSFWPGKMGGSNAQSVATQAAAAAIAQAERSLRAKAPALLAARNRAEVLDILQKEVGPTVRESALQAAAAALGLWESAKERGGEDLRDARERGGEAAYRGREAARDLGEDLAEAQRDAGEAVHDAADRATHGEERRRFLRGRFWAASENGNQAESRAEQATTAAEDAATTAEEDVRRGKAGLFWGGAGLGLALYALLDPERREKVLHFANEASVQVQELVRDMQGYDDEF